MFSSSNILYTSSIISKGSWTSSTAFEIDKEDVEYAADSLAEYDDDILAVWLLARPIPNIANGIFRHWCVKMHTGRAIIVLDFAEKDKKGSFFLSLENTVRSTALDCLYYQLETQLKGTKEFEIVASILPKLTKLGEKSMTGSDDKDTVPTKERPKERLLPFWIYKLYDDNVITDSEDESDADKNNALKKERKYRNVKKYFEPPPITKRLSDIAQFLRTWSSRYKAYDAIYANCQRFAFDLFEFLAPILFFFKKKTTNGREEGNPKKFENNNKKRSPYDVGEEEKRMKSNRADKRNNVDGSDEESDNEDSQDDGHSSQKKRDHKSANHKHSKHSKHRGKDEKIKEISHEMSNLKMEPKTQNNDAEDEKKTSKHSSKDEKKKRNIPNISLLIVTVGVVRVIAAVAVTMTVIVVTEDIKRKNQATVNLEKNLVKVTNTTVTKTIVIQKKTRKR
ncbi:hypothetical protein RFI_31444 [Reticulomyxa filosa]|uniref:Uncharacterized protein n=1 Tax=Reticulomyxa filosa TaxID=46433 RepID=X6LVK7_RETFI|nr:hypothetical protein RFI_31444 [Reticulomyxa filosa]|eukprot:ETO05953.1 hypothetical protein RFI_31444 [Reticulomyxa filosa]